MHLSDIKRKLHIKNIPHEKTQSTPKAKKSTRGHKVSCYQSTNGGILFSLDLRGAHKLIKQTAREMRIAKIIDGRLFPHKDYLPIRVSRKFLRRSLLIFDSILKEAEKRDYSIAWHQTEYSNIFGFTVHGQRITFSLFEKVVSKVPKLFIEITSSPTQSRKKWHDSQTIKLESKLDDFFDFVEQDTRAARDEKVALDAAKKKAEEERQLMLKLEAEKNERIRRFKAMQHEEQKKLDKLRRDSKAWHESQIMRQYIEAVKKGKGSEGSVDYEFNAWIKESLQFADRVDPLKSTPKSIIDLSFNDEEFLRGWKTLAKKIKLYLT